MLHTQNPNSRIICTGGAVATPTVANPAIEAEAMQAGLQAAGVPADKIDREPNARTTQENAEESFKILAQKAHPGRLHVTLVVEPYQAVRAIRAFLRVRNQSVFAQRCTIALAPAERLPVAESSPANTAVMLPRRWRSRGWQKDLDKYCEEQNRQDFERQLDEKLKLLRGY
jgi:hypothetical protein